MRYASVTQDEFSALSAVFLSLFQGESRERSVEILNDQDRPLRILNIEPSADYFTPVLRAVHDGEEYQLTLKVGPNAPVGRHEELVSVRRDDAASPELRVSVSLLVKTDVYLNPKRVDFSEVSLAQFRRDPSLSDLVSIDIHRIHTGDPAFPEFRAPVSASIC